MKLWHKNYTLEEINLRGKGTMLEHLEIRFTEITPQHLVATMPVDHRTLQAYGRLHGGASVALAESVGSTAANLCVDPAKQYCVGLDINSNHLRGVRGGVVTGVAAPIHLGRSTYVWEIKIYNEEKQIINISRLTMAVLEKP